MFTPRVAVVPALLIALLVPATALACPPKQSEAVFEPAGMQFLQSARELEQSAATEDARARAEIDGARRQQRLAVALRSRARGLGELDGAILRAKAEVADREAFTAEARAKVLAKQAQKLRAKAAQLRVLARKAVATERVTTI